MIRKSGYRFSLATNAKRLREIMPNQKIRGNDDSKKVIPLQVTRQSISPPKITSFWERMDTRIKSAHGNLESAATPASTRDKPSMSARMTFTLETRDLTHSLRRATSPSPCQLHFCPAS